MTAGRPAGRGKWRSGAWYAARPLRFLEYRAGSDCPYSGFNSSGSLAMLAAIRARMIGASRSDVKNSEFRWNRHFDGTFVGLGT